MHSLPGGQAWHQCWFCAADSQSEGLTCSCLCLQLLAQAAHKSDGLSGRALRKMPLLAYSMLCQQQTSLQQAQQSAMETFLHQLINTIDQEQQDRLKLLS